MGVFTCCQIQNCILPITSLILVFWYQSWAQKLDAMSNTNAVTQAGTGSGSGFSAFKGLEITASISPYSFASFALMKKSRSVSCTILS
jgi:hypothetical protein